MKAELLDLVRYSEWATARLVSALAPLADEPLAAPVASGSGSIRDTLAHIVSAEWIWLRRWQGESPAGLPEWVKSGSREEVLRVLAEVQSERARFLESLPEEAFARTIEYRTLAGQAYANTLADLVRHVVNHSTYHRGQATTQLRQMGGTPLSTDFVLYRREPA